MYAKLSPRGHTTYLFALLRWRGNSVALLRMFPRASRWCATALRPTAIPLRQRWRAGGIAFRSPTSYLTAHVTHHSLVRPGSLTPLGVSVWFQSEFGLSREQTHPGGRGFNFARARARSPFFTPSSSSSLLSTAELICNLQRMHNGLMLLGQKSVLPIAQLHYLLLCHLRIYAAYNAVIIAYMHHDHSRLAW